MFGNSSRRPARAAGECQSFVRRERPTTTPYSSVRSVSTCGTTSLRSAFGRCGVPHVQYLSFPTTTRTREKKAYDTGGPSRPRSVPPTPTPTPPTAGGGGARGAALPAPAHRARTRHAVTSHFTLLVPTVQIFCWGCSWWRSENFSPVAAACGRIRCSVGPASACRHLRRSRGTGNWSRAHQPTPCAPCRPAARPAPAPSRPP